MTLLNALLAKRDPEGRALTPEQTAWARGDDVTGFNAVVGTRVDRDSMLGLSAVWACVSLIGDSVATLPINAYRGTGSDAKAVSAPPAWLEEPNPEQTIIDFKFGTVASLLLDGNAYVYTIRDRLQNVVEAWLLDPRWVRVRREPGPDGTLRLVYYVMVGAGQQSPVGPFKVEAGPDMFHIMAFQPSSSWPMGIGPLDVAKMMFGSAIAGQEMAGRYFGQGFNAAGVIEVPEDLKHDQAKQLKEDFANANSGLRRMHLPPVLTGGASYKAIQISPEQAQFLQQRQFSVDEIARWFRVPPHMIGNLEKTSSWGAGIEQQSIGFVTYTLRPWLIRIERSWTRFMLATQPNVSLRFDVTDLLRGDLASLADFGLKAHMMGGMNANEFRAKYLGLPSYDGGDTYYFPVNTAPVGTEPIAPVKDPVNVDGTQAASAQPTTVQGESGNQGA